MAPSSLSSGFQSFTPLPTIKLGPSDADCWVVGLVHALGPCGSLQRTLLWGWEFLLLPPQLPQVFSIRGLRLSFPALEPLIAWSVLRPLLSSWFICVRMWGRSVCPPHWVHQPLPCCESSPTWLPVSAPPTSIDECFFISLVFRLPYSSIFCQFWLFFVFKLLLSFFWLCEEAQCVYLRLHLGQKLELCVNLWDHHHICSPWLTKTSLCGHDCISHKALWDMTPTEFWSLLWGSWVPSLCSIHMNLLNSFSEVSYICSSLSLASFSPTFLHGFWKISISPKFLILPAKTATHIK